MSLGGAYVVIPGFWRRFEEVGLREGLGRSGRLVLEAVCSDSWVWRRSGGGPVRRRREGEGEDRNKEARALVQQVGMRIKRPEL